jgi:hypothetical protein
LARTCQNGCYDAFCRPSPLYVQPGQESGKPFHPGERQKLILFQLRHRVSHYIDLQFTAVRRHTVSRKQVGQVIIITTSWGSANSISGQKVQSRYTPVGPPHPVARIAKLLRLASPSFLNLSLCVHIVLFVLRTRRRSAVASLPTRSNRPFIHSFSVHVHVPSNGKLLYRARSLHLSQRLSTEVLLPLSAIRAHGSLVTFFFFIFLQITESLIRFRFSMWVKLSQGGQCGRLLLKRFQIFPIDSGESPLFSLTSPLNFMGSR